MHPTSYTLDLETLNPKPKFPLYPIPKRLTPNLKP